MAMANKDLIVDLIRLIDIILDKEGELNHNTFASWLLLQKSLAEVQRQVENTLVRHSDLLEDEDRELLEQFEQKLEQCHLAAQKFMETA